MRDAHKAGERQYEYKHERVKAHEKDEKEWERRAPTGCGRGQGVIERCKGPTGTLEG